MHRIAFGLLPLFSVFAYTSPVFAGTGQNFNTHKGVRIAEIRSELQNSCWSFHHFDVNNGGWNPGIEGDGAMVAAADATQFGNSGISTPVLNITGDLDLSFAYTFDVNFRGSASRWMQIALANGYNDIIQVLETIRFDGANATLKKKYSTTFTNIPAGQYRLIFQYGGSGTGARLAVDEMNMSAPLKYPDGCNIAPVAVRDRVTGMANRSASGSLLQNDRDADHDHLTAYLIKGSPDGKVELSDNGSFVFTPNPNFKGNSTSFTYKICDDGQVSLCSENTTVLIHFPGAPRTALNLSDFQGAYRSNGHVELAWKTAGAASGQSFSIERSMDGQAWETSGSVNAGDLQPAAYAFTDKLARNLVQKNDLYYRLRQLNADGTTVTSRMLVVRVYNTRTLTMISVTPNPARNDISTNVQLQQDAYVSMRVVDSAGNSILHKIVNAPAGENQIILEGSSKLPAGPYSLEVIVNSKERMLVKLIKE